MAKFQPGRSGNPAGRAPGHRRRATVVLEQILDGDAEAILRRVIGLALEGDPTAMKLCIDRLISPLKDRAITFDLPPVTTVSDLPKATGAILAGVAAGELSPASAAELSKCLAVHVDAVSIADVAQRLAALEAATGTGGHDGEGA